MFFYTLEQLQHPFVWGVTITEPHNCATKIYQSLSPDDRTFRCHSSPYPDQTQQRVKTTIFILQDICIHHYEYEQDFNLLINCKKFVKLRQAL
jgi:hypothetical protein